MRYSGIYFMNATVTFKNYASISKIYRNAIWSCSYLKLSLVFLLLQVCTSLSGSIKYGDTYHIKNAYNKGSYLETCGSSSCTSGSVYQVSTHAQQDRAGVGTSKWMILSASGKSIGADVLIGDIVFLKNIYGSGSYLETCGSSSCTSGSVYQVSTHAQKDRASVGTAKWQIISANGQTNRQKLTKASKVHLKNMYGNDNYLETCGSSSCTSGSVYQVSTHAQKDRAGVGTATWSFVSPQTGVTGWNLAYVNYSGGSFEKTSNKSWVEYKKGSRNVHAYFTETSRDMWSVYLTKQGGQKMRLDLYLKQIIFEGKKFANILSFKDSGPTDIKYSDQESRQNALIYNYDLVSKEIPLTKVESGKSQRPMVHLTLASQIAAYNNQRYLNISTAGSRVAASTDGNLNHNNSDLRGYYLEYVDVEIKCFTDGFTLPTYGPSTTQAEGSVTSSSGINLSTGASLGTVTGATVNQGLNFGMSYSSDLKAFTVQDNSSSTSVKTRYKLSSTNASETWSNPKGGDTPYFIYQNKNDAGKDLVRTDAAGAFSGTPLNYLPDLAISNLQLASMGTFKAPNNFTGKAEFEVVIKLRLLKMEKTNYAVYLEWKSQPKHYTITERFTINFPD